MEKLFDKFGMIYLLKFHTFTERASRNTVLSSLNYNRRGACMLLLPCMAMRL